MGVPAVKVPIIALNKFTAPLRLFTRQINEATRPIDEMSRHIGKLRGAVSGLGSALARPLRQTGIIPGAKFIGRGIGGIGHMIGSTAGLLGIAGVGAAAGGILKLAKDTAEYGEELDIVSHRLGMTTQALQKFRYAAKMRDIDTEKFEESMTKLSANLANPKNKGLFAALGIDVSKKKSVETVMIELSDILDKIKDPNMRNFALKEIFGKGGTAMSEMFRGGRVELEKLMKERESFGLMSDRDIDKSKKFSDEWKKLGFVFEGVRNTVGLELMPSLTEGIKNFSKVMVQNLPQIKAFGASIGASLTKENIASFLEYCGAVIEILGKLGSAFKSTASFFKDWGKTISQNLSSGKSKRFAIDPETGKQFEYNSVSSPGGAFHHIESAGLFQILTPSQQKAANDMENLLNNGVPLPRYTKPAQQPTLPASTIKNLIPDYSASKAVQTLSEIRTITNNASLDKRVSNAEGLRTRATLSGNLGNGVTLTPGMVTP
jgi:hypothetical protein